VRQIARSTAECGERVHPLCGGGKVPRLRGWQRVATTNTEQVDKWWRRWPDANVGIVIPKGEFMVDIDSAKAHDEFLERVPVDGVPLVRTPRGGWHYLFTGDIDSRVLIRDEDGGKPLEVRGAGMNRVAPGSVTADGSWTLVVDAPKPPAPDEFVSWVEGTRVSKAGADVRVGRGDLAGRTIWKGQRNMLLFKQAAFLRRAGGTVESIEAFLRVHNRQCCRPPLEDEEIRRIAASAARYPLGSEWAMDPWGYAVQVAEAYGLRATDAAVLAALYRAANDSGIGKRGMRRLADETRLSRGTVQSSIRRLRSLELVAVVGESRQFGNSYRVSDALSFLHSREARQEGGPTGSILHHPSSSPPGEEPRGRERLDGDNTGDVPEALT